MRKLAFLVASSALATLLILTLTVLLGAMVPVRAAPIGVPRLVADASVTGVTPSEFPNDLSWPISLNGTGFVATPEVYVGEHALVDIGWLSSTLVTATVPWGMSPGTYTVTVVNPGGITVGLSSALTITQGIGVWQAGSLDGGELQTLAINPITPTTLFGSSEDVGLFRTRDGGEHWDFVSAPEAAAVALDPAKPTTLYWARGGYMVRSDDEGGTWTTLVNSPGQKPYPHPTASGSLFAGKLNLEAGLWHSTDYGQSWAPATTGLTDTMVADLVYHPTNPMTVVVGTKSGSIFVSGDGGQSWTFAARPVATVQTLAFSPSGELWVSDCCFCVPQKTFKSTDGSYKHFAEVLTASLKSIQFPPSGWGMVYSRTVVAAGCWDDAYRTDDNGATWSDWGPDEGGWGGSIVLDPQSTGTAYKASHQHSVYKTTDAGGNWQIANHGVTAMAPSQLATVPGQPHRVYATVGGWPGVLHSTTGGATWEHLPVTHTDGTQVSLLVDPYVSQRLYLGGQEAVYRSDDGGRSWTITGTLIAPPECSVDVQTVSPDVIAADPAKPDVLLAGTHILCNNFTWMAGGIYTSSDAGVTWSAASIAHPISQVTSLAHDPVSPTIVYAATQDTGMLRSQDGGATWQPVGASIPALANVNSLTAEQYPPYRVFALTTGTTAAGLYATDDHGDTWTQANPYSSGRRILAVQETPPALYRATLQVLLKSTDGGVNWNLVPGDLGRVPIYALAAISTTDRSILYVGTTGGLVTASAARTLPSADAGTLVSAGVHRYTALRSYRVYLPLVTRGP